MEVERTSPERARGDPALSLPSLTEVPPGSEGARDRERQPLEQRLDRLPGHAPGVGPGELTHGDERKPERQHDLSPPGRNARADARAAGSLHGHQIDTA